MHLRVLDLYKRSNWGERGEEGRGEGQRNGETKMQEKTLVRLSASL